MSGATPKLGLPYPVGTDRVSDGDNVIHALAVALDGSTAWVNVTSVGAGYAVTGLAYRKDGVGNVHLCGGLQKPGTPGGPAFNLPVGFRPFVPVTAVFLDLALPAHPPISVAVTAAGDVSWQGQGASGSDTGINVLCNLVFSTVARP